ncbi:MAG: hypothetical protein ACTHL6_08420 [Arthrobacter sp.]
MIRRATTFNLAVAIRRPPSAVFALLSDIQDFEPIPRDAAVRMVKEPAGPTAVGTRWHEWVRLAPGCWFHTESVVSDFDPPHLLGMGFSSHWLNGHLTYQIDYFEGGSILHHRETVRSHWLLRWLLPAISRSMRPRLLQRLAEIRQILESGSAGCSTAHTS